MPTHTSPPAASFSGRVNLDTFPGDTVDITQRLENVPLENYDLVLADPPYSIEDAERYQTTMVKRNVVMSALRGLSPGAHVVWLDQVFPMYRKDIFSVEAVIGMVKSTNHRFRVITVFKRLPDPCEVSAVADPLPSDPALEAAE